MNDMINALFEAGASLAIAMHCLTLYKQKLVSGLSIPAIVFFMMWGAWNVHYYPSLGQTFSFYAGILVLMVNIVYVGMLFYYPKQKKAS